MSVKATAPAFALVPFPPRGLYLEYASIPSQTRHGVGRKTGAGFHPFPKVTASTNFVVVIVAAIVVEGVGMSEKADHDYAHDHEPRHKVTGAILSFQASLSAPRRKRDCPRSAKAPALSDF